MGRTSLISIASKPIRIVFVLLFQYILGLKNVLAQKVDFIFVAGILIIEHSNTMGDITTVKRLTGIDRQTGKQDHVLSQAAALSKKNELPNQLCKSESLCELIKAF